MEKVYLYSIKGSSIPILYIGITNNPQKRKTDHFNSSSNKTLKFLIGKYGSSNFIFYIHTEGTRAQMEELEELAIAEAKDLCQRSTRKLLVCNVLVGSVSTGESTQKGENHWNAKFSLQDVKDIRTLYSLGGITQKDIGEIYNCSNKVISKITSGSRWSIAEGPICTNLVSNKKANRRKLSDEQVYTVRTEAKEEYLSTGTLDVVAISELYGISRQCMRQVLKGLVYSNLPGPILGKDYYNNYGRQ